MADSLVPVPGGRPQLPGSVPVGKVVTFRERMQTLERARALDMDPDDYERCRRAWQRYEWVAFGGARGAVEVPHVPRVWSEINDDDAWAEVQA